MSRPAQLDGAEVLYYTPIDRRHKATGKCRHSLGGELFGPAGYLAIGRYADAAGDFYLFYCNELWEVQTDTCHESVDVAMQQAEFEYEGVSATWQKVS